MPSMSEQASLFASRPTGDWWDQRVQAELRYLLRIVQHGTDADKERQRQRLESLCRLREPREAA